MILIKSDIKLGFVFVPKCDFDTEIYCSTYFNDNVSEVKPHLTNQNVIFGGLDLEPNVGEASVWICVWCSPNVSLRNDCDFKKLIKEASVVMRFVAIISRRTWIASAYPNRCEDFLYFFTERPLRWEPLRVHQEVWFGLFIYDQTSNDYLQDIA